jgi:hypothetical protein
VKEVDQLPGLRITAGGGFDKSAKKFQIKPQTIFKIELCNT